jgi:integrase
MLLGRSRARLRADGSAKIRPGAPPGGVVGPFEVRRWTFCECLTPHQYRHAAAAIIIKTTQDYELARRVLGHKSLQTTTKFYLGLESAHATERFGDIIRAQLSAESLEGVASW